MTSFVTIEEENSAVDSNKVPCFKLVKTTIIELNIILLVMCTVIFYQAHIEITKEVCGNCAHGNSH